MCGICGVVGPIQDGTQYAISAMKRALVHRGPDGDGSWDCRFHVAESDHEVALGHTRLAILDLSPLGRQPMTSDDGQVTITYNGEVYNFRSLREELTREGYRFRSDCDTEVVLQGYRAWGIRALDRFVGMFALAIWDNAHDRLLLARDRLGIKPLYYHLSEGALAFASDLNALRHCPGFSGEIDRNALDSFLRYGYVCGTNSIYSDTYRLAPGHYLTWEAGKISTSPFWRLVDCDSSAPGMDYTAAVDRLEDTLRAAVEARMVSDVPIGAFLSGGIDSSVTAALMQECSPQPIRTFSIGFKEREFDEAPFAREVSKHLGTDHTELYVDSDAAREVARELPGLYDEPYADSSAIPTVLLSRLTRNHVTVALSGDGGDELFGGYTRYAKLARLLPFMMLPWPLRRLLASGSRVIPSRSIRNGLGRLSERSTGGLAKSFLRMLPGDASLVLHCRREPSGLSRVYDDTFSSAPSESDMRRAMYAEVSTYLVDDILTKVDRASMSISLEARVPLLDHRVVEYAFQLPLSMLRRGGVAKAPLRTILGRRLPGNLFDRRKHGFGIPIGTLLATELRQWIARYLAPKRLAEEGLLDPAQVANLVTAHEREGQLPAMWNLLCFQRWFALHHR